MKIEGSCLCGQVTYQCNAPPKMMGNCHCTDCQKMSGSAYSPAMIFSKSEVSINGPVSYYESKADSGNTVRRGFCSHCGSQMFGMGTGKPHNMVVRAGTLNDTSQYKPMADVYVSSCASWDVLPEGRMSFEKMAPSPPKNA